MPRYFFVAILLLVAAVMAVGKAFYTMTVKRDYWMDMSGLLVKEGRTLQPKRGNILAADGQILAASLPEYKMYVDFMSTEQDTAARRKDQLRRDTTLTVFMDSICKGMHRIFPDIVPAKLKAHLLEGRRLKSRYWPVYTADVTTLKLKKKQNKQISYIEYSEVKKLPLFSLKSSVNYAKVDMRRRPFGELALRTIGDFKDTARYGLEMTFDSVLAGKPGTFHFQKVLNRRMSIIDTPAEDGCDVQTTLDINMQDFCEKALGDKLAELEAISGVCILMETKTGDIKAITGLSRHKDGTYHEDRALAVTDLYEPGSVFKPQSFLVAFDDGKIKLTDRVDVGSGIYKFGERKMKDHNWSSGGYGVLSVPEIIGKSSNVGVSVLIDRHYIDNPRAFVDGLYRIGSAEDLKIPLPGYEKPRIRYPGQGTYWSRTTLPWMSIGYETQVTPINTINFYNGIANNGKMVRPRLVKAILRNGEPVKEYPVEVLREHMAKPEAVRDIQQCLEYVTTKGVGKAAASKLFPVAGKTGTAQIWTAKGRTQEYFVTFAGYFPANEPQYTCIVCIRKAGSASGGGMCGPVFKKVAEYVMASRHVSDYTVARDTLRWEQPAYCMGDVTATTRLFTILGIPLRTTLPDTGAPMWGKTELRGDVSVAITPEHAGVVPDMSGYGLRDALYRLEQSGLRVRVKGVGHVVAQSIPAGAPLRPGATITLTLEGRGEKPPRPSVKPEQQKADTVKHKERKESTARDNRHDE